MRLTVTLFRIFVSLFFICLATSAHAGITIDSVSSTSSTCADNGTVTIHAHTTGGSLQYAITAGPATRPQQGSDQFINLPSGVYQLLITDASSDSSKVTDTIHGSYTSPNFTPVSKNPLCPGTATGLIVGNPQNVGTPPFTWALTNLTTNLTTNQASDSFFNLPAGGYSLREYDSCGNFATYGITLTAPNDSFFISGMSNRIFNCDSVSLSIQLFIYSGVPAVPYTIKVQTRNGTYQHVITNAIYYLTYGQIYESVGGVSYGDSINITITDACGRSSFVKNTVASYTLGVLYSSVSDSCTYKYIASFTVIGDTSQRNVNATSMPDPVTVTVSNAITNAFIDSTVTNDPVNHFSSHALSAALPSGQSYKVKITDGCGHSYIAIYQWPTTPVPSYATSIIPATCLDSTACIQLSWQNTFFSVPEFQLLSGPGSIGSTKPNFVYHDSILYPQSYPCNNGSNGYSIQLANLAAGTYHYHLVDSCGNMVTDSFTILKSYLNSDHYTASYIRGCPGQNVVFVSKDNFSTASLVYGSTSITANSAFDTIGNLSSGTYVLSLHYGQVGIAVNAHVPCQVIMDTIVIPAYQSPQMSSAAQAKCHGSVYVVFLPDSADGVAPYKYEILSGPQTTGVQSSNIFMLTQSGAYTARLTDSCGFAGTYAFNLDTASFDPVTLSGSPCLGSSATLGCQYSPYASYLWHLPAGGTYTGDSLVISPVVPSSYGTYHITKTVSIDGCRDTFYSSYTLSGTGMSAMTTSICPGQSVIFGGIARTQAGVYYDTIPASPCDSIVALTVSIRGYIYDSVSQAICTGQSVTVGPHTYTGSGIYRDTFATSGCDSIHVLDLQVNGYKHSSMVQNVCQGQSTTFGGRTLSQAGTYYDTIPTASCDSIVALTLTVSVPGYDSVSQSICTGQSVTVGNNTYTATGIYRDTFTTANCDSVYVLNLQVGGYKTGTAAASICLGQGYSFGTMTLSQAGTYYDTIPTTSCDSIVTLTLTTTTSGYDSVVQAICAGQSVTVGPNTYNTTGIYRDTFATAGCDSVYVLNLQVGSYTIGFYSQSICAGQSIQFGTMTISQAGTYYDTIPTTGCDSIAMLTVTATAPAYDSVVQAICPGQSLTIGAHVYITSGIYKDTFATANCDSIFVLNLQVHSYGHSSFSETICDGQSISFGGAMVSQSGVYSDTIQTTGCDSIVTLALTVTQPASESDTQTICQGQSVTVGTHTYSQSGTYTDTVVATGGCFTFHTLLLTVNALPTPTINITVSHGPIVSGLQIDTFTATYSGCTDPYLSWFQDIVPLGIHSAVAVVSYPEEGAKDSILCRIDCRDCPGTDARAYSNNIFTGISDRISFIQGVDIYPNPASGSFTIDINALSISDKAAQISMTDMVGQSVLSRPVTLHAGDNREVISIDHAVPGVYIVQLTADGQSLYYRLVVNKQN